jgi:hypothetical protein
MSFQVNVSRYFIHRCSGRVGWSFVVRFDPRGRPIKYIFPEEDVHEEDVDESRKKCWMKRRMKLTIQSLAHILCFMLMMMIILMMNLVLDIPDVVMDNPFNDFEGLDTNYDLDESDIELDEVQDQFDMDM